MKQQSAPLSPRLSAVAFVKVEESLPAGRQGQGEGLLEKYAQRDEGDQEHVCHNERHRESRSSEPEMAR